MRITAKTFFGTPRELETALTKVHFPHGIEMRAVITDYLEMARRRQDLWWAHADMQMHLAISLQAELQLLRDLKQLPATTEEDERQRHFLEQFTRSVVNAYTQIADGVAFRFLNFDLGLCQCFLTNQTSPYAVEQTGFLNSAGVASKVLDANGPGSQVLICDLNSITNEGDYILKTIEGYEIVEVKQGLKRRGSRLTRQTERLRVLSDLLNSRRGVLDGHEVELIELPARSHYFSHLEEGFAKALGTAFSVQQINEYQSLACFDGDAIEQGNITEIMREIEFATQGIWGKERNIELSSSHTRQWAGNVVPFSVFPLRSELIADLLLNQKMFISTINLDALFAAVERLGWDVNDLTETDMEKQPFAAPAVAFLVDRENTAKTLALSVDLLITCAVNLVDIESMLLPMKEVAQKRDDRFHWIPSYRNESAIWV